MNLRKVKEIELRTAAEGLLVQIVFAEKAKLKVQPFENSALADSDKNPAYRKAIRVWLKAVGALGARDDRRQGNLGAILRILKNHIQALPQRKDDIAQIEKALNMRVRVRGTSYRFMHDGSHTPRFIQPIGSPIRFAAEALYRYLLLYADDPLLLKHNPLAMCPACEGLFLKQRSKQEYCSEKCRFEAWRQDMKQKDAGYWARMARSSRYARKRQKEGKPRGCTKNV